MQIDAQAIREQFEAEAARRSSAGSVDFLKLGANQNEIRLLPSSPLFQCVPLHMGTINGKFTASLDYREILNDIDLQAVAVEKGWITETDVKLASQFGDPFTATANAAVALGIDAEVIRERKLWPKTRYFWNALDMTQDEPTVCLFESSKTFFTQIKDNILPKYPEIFQLEGGRNIGISGNGQDGFRRRYNAPMPEPAVSDVDVDPEDFIDLVEAAARKVKRYDAKVRDLITAHGEFLAEIKQLSHWESLAG